MDFALSQYATALDYLYARATGSWKFGLETTRALLTSLGNPHLRYPTLHVGGTNGKGSVVATLDALLRARGFRVATYTSPHLIDFRERIIVGGKPIGAEDVVRYVRDWTPQVERLGATFFEATTCMAFDYFARMDVDVAVIEVGLGGRLDATTVVEPIVAGVSSIGFDHIQYLGSTLPEIAREKAGIFKRSSAAAIAEGDPEIRRLLASLAEKAGSRPISIIAEESTIGEISVTADGTSFCLQPGAATAGRTRRLKTPLVGAHQAMNTTLALRMLELAGKPFDAAAVGAESALAGVRLPGRFHRSGKVILDVAHNAPGANVLAATLAAVQPEKPVVALVAVLADKDWRSMLHSLSPEVDRFIFAAPPSVPAERAWRLDEPVTFAREQGWAAESRQDFDEALTTALAGAGTTLVTGSFHTVGDAMARLQLSALDG